MENCKQFKAAVEKLHQVKGENIEKQIAEIAKLLFETCIFKAGNIEFRLAEIEFYFASEAHKDPFIYKKPEQLEFGKFMKHASGFDITFGNGTNYGGILVRGIRIVRTEGKEYLHGPLNVYKLLTSKLGDIKNLEVRETGSDLPVTKENEVVSFSRYGLGLKTEDPDGYRAKNYRFILGRVPECKPKEKEKIARHYVHENELGKEKGWTKEQGREFLGYLLSEWK